MIIIVIELMFLGINMFLALLRPHFNPRYARAKMILSRAKNIFMPANVNSIVILYKLHIVALSVRNVKTYTFFVQLASKLGIVCIKCVLIICHIAFYKECGTTFCK